MILLENKEDTTGGVNVKRRHFEIGMLNRSESDERKGRQVDSHRTPKEVALALITGACTVGKRES